MRYLRDTTLLAWTILVLLLAGVLLYAHTAATPGSGLPLTSNAPAGAVAATNSAATTQVEQLRGLAPTGI